MLSASDKIKNPLMTEVRDTEGLCEPEQVDDHFEQKERTIQEKKDTRLADTLFKSVDDKSSVRNNDD